MTLALLLFLLSEAAELYTAGAVETLDGRMLSWGSSLQEWSLTPLRSRTLLNGPFGEGGCLADLDRDGRQEFVSVRGSGLGDMVWVPLRSQRQERIDEGVEMSDCVQADLFGRRGILMIHRGAQVRFYERIGPGKWRSRDIYSIYTPSYQRGLALADVDGDGLRDIFCGNYWIRSPRRFEEPWRLFAIHTWFEDPDSAAVRIAVIGPRKIAVGQARHNPARLAIFEAPPDPTQPWLAQNVPHDLGRIKALAVLDGQLLAAGDGGVMRDGTLLSRTPVTAMASTRDGKLFVAGTQGVELLPQRPPRK